MMRRLFNNTLLAAVAFVITGLIGLAIVPIIIGKWGLAALGVVVLARAFIPQGFLSLFDFGVSELATQAVARARVNGAWSLARSKLKFLLASMILVGVAVGAALWLSADFWATFLRIDQSDAAEFASIVRVSGLASAFLLPALVGEGIVKGFEHYKVVRSLEVGSAMGFFLVVVAILPLEVSFSVAAYAYVATLVLRYMVLSVVAVSSSRRPPDEVGQQEAFNSGPLLRHMGVMAQSKVIGVAQNQTLLPLVAALFGPSAAGLIDLLTRLPRFAKQVLSVLNTSLLPVATRMDESGQQDLLGRLSRAAFVVLPAVTVPPLVGAAVLCRPILTVWLGSDYAGEWVWMSIMFLVPIVAQYVAFGGIIMLARPKVQATLNLLTLVQVVLTAAVGFGLVFLFAERAFIVGQCTAVAILLPFQLVVLGRQMNTSLKLLAKVIITQAAIALPLAIGVFWLQRFFTDAGLAEIVIGLAIWCGMFWSIEYLVLLSPVDRAEIHRVLQVPLDLLRGRHAGGANK